MHPELIKIGTFTIYSYGFFVSLAFILGMLVALWIGHKQKVSPEIILDGVFIVMLMAVFGARVFYVIEFWRDYSTVWDIFKIWQGGLVFFGGLVFSIIGLIIFSLARKVSVFKVLDIAACATALAYSVGRLGCFFNGCCYGVAANIPWAVTFPHLHVPRHPTQLYSSLAGVFIFIVLYLLIKHKRFDGELFSVGLVLYSVYRFLNEFLRINPRYLFGLSEAQLISILLFVIGVSIYAILYRRTRSKPTA